MEKKQLPVVFKEFIQCLNSNKVKYLLVGGWAVGLCLKLLLLCAASFIKPWEHSILTHETGVHLS